MKINLEQIYSGLESWRAERGLTAESQKKGYMINVMEELGEMSQALRGLDIEIVRKTAEYGIIDAICDISVFTINAGADLPASEKLTVIDMDNTQVMIRDFKLSRLINDCANFDYYCFSKAELFNDILVDCAKLCEYYGFDYEIAMEETIKEISSRTGAYSEEAKKWVKDTSDEAKAKWYQANYELARY